MVSFWNVTAEDNDLYIRRNEAIKKCVYDFFEKHHTTPNILSGKEVYKRHDKFSFFPSIWKNKYFLENSLIGNNRKRDSLPVVFGLESGICFYESEMCFLTGFDSHEYFRYSYQWFGQSGLEFSSDTIVYPLRNNKKKANIQDVEVVKEFFKDLTTVANNFDSQLQRDAELKQDIVRKRQSEIQLLFNKNGSGKVDLIENDFQKLLNKNQKLAIEVDRNYVQQFVKISNYINTKKKNIQRIFEALQTASSIDELEEMSNLLKNQVHGYELLVFHSIYMIGALVEDDMITFYEIYESFDKLGIFNSNWENDVAYKLSNISYKLDDLLHAMNEMENRIVNSIGEMNYMIGDSFDRLNSSISKQLESIDSSIKFNNLLNGIQTYQLYKINNQTK